MPKDLPVTSHTGQEFYVQKPQTKNPRTIATAQTENRQQNNGKYIDAYTKNNRLFQKI